MKAPGRTIHKHVKLDRKPACVFDGCGFRSKKIMASLVKLEDFEEEARKRLDRNAWGYYSSGATTEQSLKDNVDAYSR